MAISNDKLVNLQDAQVLYNDLRGRVDNKINSSDKGSANGVAELDSNGKVPSSQLPSYVDDVEEYDAKDFTSWAEWVGGTSYAVGDKAKITDNGTVTGYICKTANSSAVFDPTEWDEATKFPIAGEAGKIYIANDTNITYRWGGSAYVPIGSDLALGETSSTAYRGDRGKAAYDAAVVNPDSAPTASSDNLVKSGGVYSAINAKYTKPANGIPATDLESGVIPGDMTGAGASTSGTHGLIPAPSAGDEDKYFRGDGVWSAIPVPDDMTGASSSAAGTHGLVPAPSAGDEDKFFKGDGTWGAIDAQDFTGASASEGGSHGFVPAPAAGEQSLVLMGSGDWEMPPNARLDSVTMTVTNVSGAYSGTVSSDEITQYSAPMRLEISNPSAFRAKINVAPSTGYFTVTCNNVVGTSTLKIEFLKQVQTSEQITSAEFDILNNRLLAVENVYTDTDISIAVADWIGTPKTYTWSSDLVTSACGFEIFLRDGAESAGIEDFNANKVTGGIQFTTDEVPTGALPLTIRIINCRATDIDDLKGTYDIPFTIQASAWSENSPYTYTWLSEYVTSDSGVEVVFYSGNDNTEISYLDYERVSGGIQFTAAVKPTTNITVCAHIDNTLTYNYTAIAANMVSTNAISGAANVDEALEDVDDRIDTLNSKIATVNTTLGNAVLSTTANTGMKIVDTFITFEDNSWKLVVKTKDGTLHKVSTT